MHRFLFVPLCVLLSGCVAVGGDPLTMTFNSDVSGGVAYQHTDNALLGPLPVRIEYDIANTPINGHGCFLVSGVRVEWQSGYQANTPATVPLCIGARHYDYHIPYENPDPIARSDDRRYAYTRANPLPGSAAGAVAHVPLPAASVHPSALENLLGAIAFGSALHEIQQELYGVTDQSPYRASRVNPGSKCQSQLDCDQGQRCAKPIHSNIGVCIRPMDEEELRQRLVPEFGNLDPSSLALCKFSYFQQPPEETTVSFMLPCPE